MNRSAKDIGTKLAPSEDMGTSRSDQPFVVLPLSSHDALDDFRSETEVIHEMTPQRHGEGTPLTRNTVLTSAAMGLAATLAVVLFTPALVTSTQPANRIDATAIAERSIQGAIVPDAPVAATVAAPKLETSDRSRGAVSAPIRRPITPTAPIAKKSTVPVERKLPRVNPSRNATARTAAPAAALVATNRPQPVDLPTATVEKPVAVAVDAEVTAITSHDNRKDLTYRWSAPVGTFADAAAGQTTFACPVTPQRVVLTVTVTDANGTTVTDTVTVQCVAAQR